jgi:ribosomal protein L23
MRRVQIQRFLILLFLVTVLTINTIRIFPNNRNCGGKRIPNSATTKKA